MSRLLFALLLTGAGALLQTDVHAQGFMKKLKDKANEVANKAIDKAVDKKVDETLGTGGTGASDNGQPAATNTGSRSGKPVNRTGEGLKNTTPPDVLQKIDEAEKANASGNYSEARYAIQQALLGIEIQLGKQILLSLPDEVAGLHKDTTEDRVTSNRWGWANLMINRTYQKDDKQLSVLIGNNSLYAGLTDIYFAGNYAQSNGNTQNFKQIKVKDNKAIIKFDEHEGYTLLVHLGQSGMVTFQAINFANEQEVMNAVNTFDIDAIKRMLGEK